ncbi:MAG: class IV adenylate cyclase [Candidatus Diapherotrites archaeon]
MAKNVEIEIRFPINKNTFFKIKNKLKKTAKFVKKSHQIDEYFTPSHRNFVKPKNPFEWLSIRKRGNKAILNYKHWYYPKNSDSGTHCDEFETEISNPNQLKKIFSALDLKKLVKVEKQREVYLYKNEFEIALDKVRELGNFIEIETIKDFGNVKKAREKLFEFAGNLEIDISKIDKKGFPYLLMKRKGFLKF